MMDRFGLRSAKRTESFSSFLKKPVKNNKNKVMTENLLTVFIYSKKRTMAGRKYFLREFYLARYFNKGQLTYALTSSELLDKSITALVFANVVNVAEHLN